MGDEKCLVCPTCGKTEVTHKHWADNLSRHKRTRALWATPYPRYGRAWLYENHIDEAEELFKRHGVVESVSFGSCGYQGIEMGLSLTVQLEGGLMSGWTFYNFGDIAEFMNRAKAGELKDLIGTPVHSYGTAEGMGGETAGIDVVDSLVLERRSRR